MITAMPYILVHKGGRFFRIPIDYLVYIKTGNTISRIYTCDGNQYDVQQTLHQIYELIKEQIGSEQKIFQKMGDMYIVNLNYILWFDPYTRKIALYNYVDYYCELIVPRDSLDDVLSVIQIGQN